MTDGGCWERLYTKAGEIVRRFISTEKRILEECNATIRNVRPLKNYRRFLLFYTIYLIRSFINRRLSVIYSDRYRHAFAIFSCFHERDVDCQLLNEILKKLLRCCYVDVHVQFRFTSISFYFTLKQSRWIKTHARAAVKHAASCRAGAFSPLICRAWQRHAILFYPRSEPGEYYSRSTVI